MSVEQYRLESRSGGDLDETTLHAAGLAVVDYATRSGMSTEETRDMLGMIGIDTGQAKAGFRRSVLGARYGETPRG